MRQVERLHRFRDRGIGARRAKEGEDLRPIALVSKRQHQNRRRIGIGRGNTWKGVLGPWAILHGEHAKWLAVGDATVTIGNSGSDTLLSAQIGADADPSTGFDDRRRRVTTEELHALSLHDLSDGIDHFHVLSSFST
jgi:hypothetical protein